MISGSLLREKMIVVKSTLEDTTNTIKLTVPTATTTTPSTNTTKLSPKELAKLRRRQRRKRQMIKEFDNLRSLIPTLREYKDVSKVNIIYEAVKYIDELHDKILNKILTESSDAVLPAEAISAMLTPPPTPTTTSSPATAMEADLPAAVLENTGLPPQPQVQSTTSQSPSESSPPLPPPTTPQLANDEL